MTLKIPVRGVSLPDCKRCGVRYKSCGLKPESCSNTFYPISDKEIEFILQINENLPEDEMEIPVRNLLVMDVRERINPPDACLVRSRSIDNTKLFAALDKLYKFVDGLDPDFIIRERISIIKSRLLKSPDG